MATITKASLITIGAMGFTVVFAALSPNTVRSRGGCGPTSLYALCQRLNVHTNQAEVFRLFGNNIQNCSFADIATAANTLHLRTRGVEVTENDLRHSKLLGIVHVNGNHFIAITSYTSDSICVADPIDMGKVRNSVWSYDYLATMWDGYMLVLNK